MNSCFCVCSDAFLFGSHLASSRVSHFFLTLHFPFQASGYSARPAAGQVQPMLKLGILSFSRMLFALVEDSSNQNPALCQLALSFLKEQLDELPALSVAPNVKMDAAEVSMQAMDSAANFLVRLAGRQESPELTKMAIEMLLGMAVSRGVCPRSFSSLCFHERKSHVCG